MFEKLEALAQRYEEIQQNLYDPTVTAQPDLFASLMKQSRELQPIAEAYAAYTTVLERLNEAESLLT